MDISEQDDARGDTLNISLAAAQRWRSRTPERRRKEAALKDGRYTDADTKPRLAKRVARLHAWERAALGARALPAGRGFEAVPAEALRPADVTDELVERQIGRTRDLLSIEFFEQGLDAARSVGLIVTDNQANGTGFLVADDLVMTNHHVLRDAQEAARSSVRARLRGQPLRYGQERAGLPARARALLPQRRGARLRLVRGGQDLGLGAPVR